MIEAVEWWTAHRQGDPSRADREGFVDWLCESPAHIAEYLEVASLWEELGHIDMLEGVDLDALLAAPEREPDNVVPLPTAAAVPEAPRTATGAAAAPARRGRSWLLSAVAALVITAAVGWWALSPQSSGGDIVATTIGEQRSLALGDGSVVDLNTQTTIRVRLDPAERRIELLEGEALFDIAPHEEQVFVVVAGTTEIHVLGTKFNVYRPNDRTATVTVTVLKGRVVVRHVPRGRQKEAAAAQGAPRLASKRAEGEGSASIELTEGQQARIDLVETTIQQEPTDLQKVVAWTDRRLIFENTALSDVVAEFNRYNTKQLHIDDPTLSALQLNGVFRPHDPDSLLQYLKRTEGVQVRELAAKRLITR